MTGVVRAARGLTAGAAVGMTVLASVPAAAVQISVGAFTSTKSCSLYSVTSGRSAAMAVGDVAVAVSAFKTQLVRDCVQNFPDMRATLATALAASGKLGGARHLILTGKIMDAGTSSNSFDGAGVTLSSSDMTVMIEYQLKDAAGHPVYGGNINKTLALSSDINSGDATSSGAQGEPPYTRLKREAAFAVARDALFKVEPLRVIATDGQRVKLNYGGAFVPLGSAVMVEANGRLEPFRLSVTASPATGAIAESETGDSIAGVSPGSIVTFSDADDPESNGVRHHRVRLPQN